MEEPARRETVVQLRAYFRGNQPLASARPRRLVATSLPYVVSLLVAAFTIWFLAIAASWEGHCPRHGVGEFSNAEPTGLDKGVYVWPPGAQCYADNGIENHQAWPWAPWAILSLIAGAGGVLLFGIVVTIRDMRVGSVRSHRSSTAVAAAEPPEGTGTHRS